MHDVPAWVETARGVILFVVWSVLVLRLPALRRPAQRPVWIVLALLATGALFIQQQMGHWVDDVTGVPKAGELAVALIALCDFTAVWWFSVTLHAAGHRVPAWLRRAPVVCAATMAVLAFAFFAVTPVPDRFGAQAHGWWAGYAACWITFGTVTAVGAAACFWRDGLTMRSPVLRLSVLALALGTSAELPYLVVRGVRWYTDAPGWLQLLGFWCSFARFVLVALGCSLAAVEPLRQAAVHWYRRQRLHGLWLLLRRATPELVVVPPPSRTTDLLARGDSWELLHQRVIEIHDSITFLHDGWATPELLDEVGRGRERLVATACWIEVTRRDAVEGLPKVHHEDLDKDLLPEVVADRSTVPREIRHLLRLHRALRSRPVRSFADGFRRQASPAASA
ncbi:hypothetical protein GCM10010218_16830 [Streptomyces mashuensis]|uniref:DUF6545 domain-containing protein n=1 Tax=Streptomyces mashuensis TaxID=33904 RepID=A0A919B1K3_9ACTN|nr:DUF6545 domain-containing protein [Streptomyces mashuensis]GHF36008.1 hypothetical protein GCM10010218_16830 [Streptomyces mashuensis]